jgi:hypothetical protein
MMRVYVGSYKIRTSKDVAYIHIPVKLALQLGTRRVRVFMQVASRECNNLAFHGTVIIFPATLTRVGDTFRLKLPKKYLSLAERIKDCSFVDVWLEPRLEDWKTKKPEHT